MNAPRLSHLYGGTLLFLLLSLGLTVQTTPTFTTQIYPSRVGSGTANHGFAGDLNGDGIPDLALCCDQNLNAWIQISNTVGGFRSPVTLGERGLAMDGGDFNEDGRNDIIQVNSTHGVSFFFNNGSNSFTRVESCLYGRGTDRDR